MRRDWTVASGGPCPYARPVSKRDYYEVLGVPRGASPDTLKKAFRSLARELHPDRNPDDPAAEARFKEAAEAYQVLSDPTQRERYDRFGHAAFESGGGPGPADFGGIGEIFEGLIGEIIGGRRKKRQGDDIEVELTVSFEDAALGAEKKVPIAKPVPCATCEGTGAKPGTAVRTCGQCEGKGEVKFQRRLFSTNRKCPACNGSGTKIETPCRSCHGAGVVDGEEEMIVRIPPGVEDGATRTIRGAGGPGPGGNGDLLVTIRVEAHPLFERDGADVLCTVPVSFPQAVLGDTLEVPTLEGSVKMKLPPATQSGKMFRLRGKGIPVYGGMGKGDQLVTILVEIPDKVSRKQRKLIAELADELGTETHPQRQSFLSKLKDLLE